MYFNANTRTQSDNLGDKVSADTGLACPPDEDNTRQEFAEEADINVLLRKYGVVPPQRPATFGTMDFDLDLQLAYEAVREADAAIAMLPVYVLEQLGGLEAAREAFYAGRITPDAFKEPAESSGSAASAAGSGQGGGAPAAG